MYIHTLNMHICVMYIYIYIHTHKHIIHISLSLSLSHSLSHSLSLSLLIWKGNPLMGIVVRRDWPYANMSPRLRRHTHMHTHYVLS